MSSHSASRSSLRRRYASASGVCAGGARWRPSHRAGKIWAAAKAACQRSKSGHEKSGALIAIVARSIRRDEPFRSTMRHGQSEAGEVEKGDDVCGVGRPGATRAHTTGGPAMTSRPTAASDRMIGHDGSNSDRRRLNFAARGWA